jgi:hypothetical protein
MNEQAPAYSLWDTLVELRLPRPAAFGFTPRTIREKRCQLRTARYDAAASAGLVDPTLADDFGERRMRWEFNLETPQKPPVDRPRKDWSWWDFLWLGWDEMFILASLVAAVAFAVAGLVLLAVWIPLHMLRFIRRTRCRKAIHRCLCPDCSYDLHGVPDAIQPDSLDGRHVGPAKCPECGAPWPLLPPPISGPALE